MARYIRQYYVEICCHDFDPKEYLAKIEEGVKTAFEGRFENLVFKAEATDEGRVTNTGIKMEISADGKAHDFGPVAEEIIKTVSPQFNLTISNFVTRYDEGE